MAKVSPFQFIQQVRAEGRKVVWPTRRETLVSFVIVLILVFIFLIFLSLVNWASSIVVENLLNLPSIITNLKTRFFG